MITLAWPLKGFYFDKSINVISKSNPWNHFRVLSKCQIILTCHSRISDLRFGKIQFKIIALTADRDGWQRGKEATKKMSFLKFNKNFDKLKDLLAFDIRFDAHTTLWNDLVLDRYYKLFLILTATIAPWIYLHLLSCGRGFQSPAQYLFFNTIAENTAFVIRTMISKK